MPITCEFEYHKPKTLSDAVKILAKHGKRASVLAGGTDLLVWLKDGVHAPAAVVDVKGIQQLHRLELRSEALFVGACVTFTELLECAAVRDKLPLLWECSRTVASVGVRNRATLAGNICSAVPSLDGAPALLDYEAVVSVQGPKGKREIPIGRWFIGPKKTALRKGELVLGVKIPLPKKKNGACYVRLGRYRGEDLAQVGVGILALAGDEYRVSFCAVGPVPARAGKIERCLNGKKLTSKLIREAQDLVPDEIQPISDVRAGKEYRMHMARVMLERGLKAAVARMNGDGSTSEAPAYGESLI
jgi:carbon-monoxide dehydrogenase medium subunit